MLNIGIVTLKSANKVATLDTLKCPVSFRLMFCRTLGYGKARNIVALKFGSSGLMVQFNDDLVLSNQIWEQIINLKQGEFMLTHDGEHLCSRVFAIHLEDFSKIKFDESIKYCFEDGDFAYRAQQNGLKLKVLSPNFAKHIPHPHSFYNPKRIIPISWEFCKMFVKYKRNFNNNPLEFFFPFHDYKVIIQHLILRVTFTVIWIIKGVN